MKPQETVMGEFGLLPPEPENDLVVELEASLRQIQASETGVAVDSQLLRGDPARQIGAETRDLKCDLIVIGSHGRTWLGQELMGSVAVEVTRAAPCAVLTVKLEGADGGEPRPEIRSNESKQLSNS
jgi:nucleotide-binding universal stress UspA family protein